MPIAVRLALCALLLLHPGAGAASAGYGWFWDLAASPVRNAARPARMAALGEVVLRRDPQLRRLVPVARRVLRVHAAALDAASRRGGVSPPLLLALVVIESGGDPQAVSPRGAMGLGQLMPDTAERFGVDDPFRPRENLRAAARYLDWLLDRFGQDAVLALAAYNAGEGAVDSRGGVPAFAETRAYVPRVLGLWAALRRWCPRLPSHPRHACPLG
jgi:soluble lytic murein transglycosylase-like protein